MTNYYLGIDTSNYTTSVAIVDQYGHVISDERKILEVKKGNRGLRQSEAFFQHVINLPHLYDKAVRNIATKDIKTICVSKRPRNLDGSYMPVFRAGESFAKVISDTLKIPLYECSHQEGHMQAITAFNKVSDSFVCLHLSGGTTEVLDVKYNSDNGKYDVKIIGGSLDISIGQLIDRVGVSQGLEFPAGQLLDKKVLNSKPFKYNLKHIKVNGFDFNLSGIETHLNRNKENYSLEDLSYILFTEIILCLQKIIDNIKQDYRYKNKDIVFVGGVSQSRYLRENINRDIIFGKFGSDNAVGVALIGGKRYGIKTN